MFPFSFIPISVLASTFVLLEGGVNYMDSERTEIELEATVLLKIRLNRAANVNRSLGM